MIQTPPVALLIVPSLRRCAENLAPGPSIWSKFLNTFNVEILHHLVFTTKHYNK